MASGKLRMRGILAPAALLIAALGACTTDGVMAVRPDVDVGTQTAGLPVVAPEPAAPSVAAAEQAAPDAGPLSRSDADVPEEEQVSPDPAGTQSQPAAAPMTVAYPRLENPVAPPMSQPRIVPPRQAPAVMPADEIECRQQLRKLHVAFRDLPPINGGGACRVDYPVQVSAIGSVKMVPAATLGCAMAETFSRWTQKELVPSARWRFWSGVAEIRQASSYSCRNIRGSRTPSEHSKGNALDVMAIKLTDGKLIDVRKPGFFAFRQRGFLNTVRADGCEYFTTVLGPGYNPDHANHFHFDLMHRRNGHIACR